jgi:peptidylprolyl isomerase
VSAALLIPALAACGEEKTGLGDPTEEGFSAVTVEGEQGKAPEVEWKSAMSVEETSEKTLVEGDGDEIADGDKASVYLYIGNGTTREQAYSDWEQGSPMELTADAGQVSEVLVDLLEGSAVGSRVAAVTTAKDMFGEAGNAQLGVGNADTLLVVMDVMEKVVPPAPVDVPAGQMPKIVEKDGKPVGFDFQGIAKPDPEGELQRTILTEGDGAELTLEDTVSVNYLGQVYQGEKPFDDSYSKGQPAEFALTGVVEGWTYGLEGVKVGSRVLLAIPPASGYGPQGNPSAGIKGTDTLYFVVDVLETK